MEIRRFGIGHRRPDGPPGTTGVSGSVVESGPHATIAELAFARGASVHPHANRNATWFLVIEGGGFVRVGDQQARVGAGEAVMWPAGEVHAAWTELSEMRAIVVEIGAADPTVVAALLPVGSRETPGGVPDAGATTEGSLVVERAQAYDPSEGEPV